MSPRKTGALRAPFTSFSFEPPRRRILPNILDKTSSALFTGIAASRHVHCWHLVRTAVCGPYGAIERKLFSSTVATRGEGRVRERCEHRFLSGDNPQFRMCQPHLALYRFHEYTERTSRTDEPCERVSPVGNNINRTHIRTTAPLWLRGRATDS